MNEWSRDKPRVEGWYWHKGEGAGAPIVVNVRQFPGYPLMMTRSGHEPDMELGEGEWAGPLQVPKKQ